MTEAFLESFEQKRLALEQRLMGMPEARQALARFGAGEEMGQRYLHALPTCLSLLAFMAQSPRTADAFQAQVERAGPVRLRHHEAPKAFTCFGIAYLYRAIVKSSGEEELGLLLCRMATLMLLTPRELERVDLVTQTLHHRARDGRRDRLAPANLLLWWLIGSESPAKAFEADTFLQQFKEYLETSLDFALEHQIWMRFPW